MLRYGFLQEKGNNVGVITKYFVKFVVIIHAFSKSLNMDYLFIVLSVLVFGLLCFYVWTLLKEKSEERFWTTGLIAGAVVTAVVGFLVHVVVMSHMAGGKDWLTIGAMSLTCTAEMFLGSTKMFDNGFNDFLFSGHDLYIAGLSDVCLVLLTGAFLAALVTSGYIVLTFFFRRFASRSWVKRHRPESGQMVHVFFGDNPNSRLLSEDVSENNPGDMVLRIDYPEDADADVDASLWSRLLTTFSSKDVSKVEGITILKSRRSLSNVTPDDFAKSFGLDLKNWLTHNTIAYLLSDDEKANRKELCVLLQAISKGGTITCGKIYCHGRRTELDVETEYAYQPEKDRKDISNYPEIIFRDSSELAIRSLLLSASSVQKSALPVDYVSIAVDEKGKSLGYVDSVFKSIIIGLGGTGLEALKFLYEYASFPDKDGKRSPFLCRVFDRDISSRLKLYYEELSWATALTTDTEGRGREIEFINEDLDTEGFWSKFEDGIEEVNCIFICLGDDKLNLDVANRILNHHLKGRDTGNRFVIMLRQSNPDDDELLNKTIQSINKKNNNCIRVFGKAREIWRQDVISDDSLKEKAIRYYSTYQKANTYPAEFVNEEAPKLCITPEGWDSFIWGASIEQKKKIEMDWVSYWSKKTDEQRQEMDVRWFEKLRGEWDRRDEIIRSGRNLKDRTKSLRQRTQDISNVLHASTKLALMPEWMLERAGEISNAISGKFFGKFYDGDDKSTESILNSLAIGEHLRWNASHTMLGYNLGEETDDLLRTHDCLKDYDDLDKSVQHFDWLVVKTTLRLHAESGNPCNRETQEG